MDRTAQTRKKVIRWALGVLLALDVALVLTNWRLAATNPKDLQLQRKSLQRQRDLLKADADRALAIKLKLPAVQQECDQFFAAEFREASSGYSSIEDDLGGVAKEAGLHASSVNFHQREVPNRGVVEVEVAAIVEGDYPSLVRFINGLERSKNFYLLDSLQLASGATGGTLKLNLQLRTYFRS
jgi:hypothetical protein